MQKYHDTVQSRNSGRPVSGASVLVKTLAGVTATIYSDNGVTPISNPLTTDANGYFSFYAADGRYTLTISGAGIGTRTISDVLLEDPADEDGAIGTLQGGVSALQSSVGALESGKASLEQLAASGGSALVGWIRSATGAVARTVADWFEDHPSVMDFIPFGTRVAIRLRTNTTELTSYLQAALNRGGSMHWPAGEYLTDALTIPTRTCLHFAGVGQVTIKLKNNATGHLLSFATDVTERVQFRGGFTIDGNKANQTIAWNGVHLLNNGSASAHRAASGMGSNDPRHHIEEVVIWNCKGNGWHSEGRSASFFGKISTYECDGHGIYINSFDTIFGELDAGGSGLHGIFLDSSAYNNRIGVAKSWFSGMVNNTTSGDGLHCRGYYNQIGPIEIQDSRRHGLYLYQATANIMSAVHVESPGVDGTGAAGACGIRIYDSRSNSIAAVINDRDATPSMAYGVYFEDGASGPNFNIVQATVQNAIAADYFASAGVINNNLLLLNGPTNGPRIVGGAKLANTVQVQDRIRVKNTSSANFDLREAAADEVVGGFSSVQRQHYSASHGVLPGTLIDTIGGGTENGEWRLNHWNGTAVTNIARGYANGDFGVAGGAWNAGCQRIGAYRLWVDASGRLRIKNGAPTSDTDGTVVGTQA